MTLGAWSRLRRNWRLDTTPALTLQNYVVGSMLSAFNQLQLVTTEKRHEPLRSLRPIFILGYWRSGTTLLHDYLSLDERFGFPTTYACMNPQHFVLTQTAALKSPSKVVSRPMDAVTISAASPQEDEFGLLALGARSPYEAVMVPWRHAESLALGDPDDLELEDRRRWCLAFRQWVGNLSVVAQGRPLLLKSPPHGYRVALLRRLFPQARFVLIVRSPQLVFESTVRMWRSLFALYSLGALPAEEETRNVVLDDRPRFEAKLNQGLHGLPEKQFALVRYEDLVEAPLQVIARLYERLELADFSAVERKLADEIIGRSRYQARNTPPPEPWSQRVGTQWQAIFERYRYSACSRP